MFLFYILSHLCIPLSSHSFIIYTKITLSRLFPNTFLVYELVLCAKILQLFSWLLLQIDFRKIGQFLKLKVHYFCTRGHQNLQTLLTTHYSFLFSQQQPKVYLYIDHLALLFTMAMLFVPKRDKKLWYLQSFP